MVFPTAMRHQLSIVMDILGFEILVDEHRGGKQQRREDMICF
jgi:hypothetical protein